MKKCIMAAVAAAGAAAFAAQTDETESVAAVTVYASRTEATAGRMPAHVEVFGAEEIAKSGAQSLPNLLEMKANLQIRTLNSNPLQSQIAMRGYGENSFGRVKVLLDGEELNFADMEAPDLARIPLESVERVEIIRGPSPVLHGDGASAGVVNVVTDTGKGGGKTGATVRGGSYGTFGANFRTRGEAGEDGVRYNASYGYSRSDGYRARSAYDIHSSNARVMRDFANGARLGLGVDYSNAYHEMPGALTKRQWKDDPRQALNKHDWCRLWNAGFKFDAKARLADEQWLMLDAVFSMREREANWGAYGYANEYALYNWQFAPRYVNSNDLAGHGNEFTLGLDFKYDRYEVEDRSRLNAPEYAFDRARWALFAREEFYVTDELSAVAGARAEFIDNRWSRYRGLNESHTLDVMGDFELGLVYRPAEGLKTFAKGTRFHRSAFCDELNYTEDGKFLAPETGTSLDFGFEYAFLKEWKVDASGYWTLIDDEIFYNPYARDFGGYWGGYNSNSPGRTQRLGADAGVSWRREYVAEASLKASFVDARFTGGQYENEAVPLVPEARVRFEAGVWLCEDVEVKGGCRYVSRQHLSGDFANAHERLPGYVLFDLGIYWEPAFAEGWKGSFTMDNLFGRKYCDFAGWSDYSGGYYYPACGRSFTFSVSYEF